MKSVRSELIRFGTFVALGAVVGAPFGMAHVGITGACLVLTLRHVYLAHRLVHWLRYGKVSDYPQTSGLWDEAFYLVYQVRRRSKRRKKRLLKMLERFREATAALPDATVVLGEKHEIEWFNQAAGQLLGLRKDDIGQNITNLVRSPRFSDYLRACDYRESVGINSPNSDDIQLDIRVVPYADGLFMLLAQDVTRIRFMERVRSDFVANVSHELRTPLTVLRGYVEALQETERAVPERLSRIYARMGEQTKRMQNLVDDLLSLTRLEAGIQQQPAKVVDVPRLLRIICDDARFMDGEEHPSIQLSVETDADLWGVEPDLVSAFSNLVVNAVKFTPPDGAILVRWHEDSAGVYLEVVDNGCGVAPEHIPRLTERFYRVESPIANKKTGTGLGLAIVKHVLSRHDAQLKIASDVGQGSRFTCFFPESRIVREPRAIAS